MAIKNNKNNVKLHEGKAVKLKSNLKKTAFVSSIFFVCLAVPIGSAAQDNARVEEEVIITGVRAAQASAINTKRNAVSVVDGISAEDIGKLPDVTISDSLQRITGVQVERTAGESGPVQIRGLSNVATTLNGETFLSATTIDKSTANFADLPSQLFSGVDVFKSPIATLSSLGVSGTVDLKTRRPFDMDEGFVYNLGAEVDQGSKSGETDPTLTGLFSWQNEKVGFLVAFVTAKKNLATDFNGYFDTSENGGIGAANNNHVSWDSTGPDRVNPDIYHVVPQGFSAFHKEEERHRDGLNFSFQADLGEGFDVTADYFYSKQERWNRRAGISHNNRWSSFNNYARPVNWGENSFTLTAVDEVGGEMQRTERWRTVTAFDAEPFRLQSFTQTNKNIEISQNSNLELNYDNGGALTGQVRLIRSHATAYMRHGYSEGDLLSIDGVGSQVNGPGGFVANEYCKNDETLVGIGDTDGDGVSDGLAGCYADYSPGGIEEDAFNYNSDGDTALDSVRDPDGNADEFIIRYDASGTHPTFSGFDTVVSGGAGERTVAEYMADIQSYHVGAFSSEGNTDDKADMTVVSTKWNYKLDEDVAFISSIDFGVRNSVREVEHRQFSYFAQFGKEGCMAQWKAVDQFTDSSQKCQEGEWLDNPAFGTMVDNPNYVEDDDGNPLPSRYQNGDIVLDGDGNPVYEPEQIPASERIFEGYTMLPPTALNEHNNVIWVDDFGGVEGLPGIWVADPYDYDDTLAFQEKVFGPQLKVVAPGQSYDVTLSELSYFAQANIEAGSVSGNLGLKVVETEINIRQNEVGETIPHSGASIDIGDVVTKRNYTDYLPSLNITYALTDDINIRGAYGQTMQPLNLLEWGGGKSIYRVFNNECQCMRISGGRFAGHAELEPTRATNYDLSFEWYVGDASMFNLGLYRIEIDSFVQPGTVLIDESDDDGIHRGPFTFKSPVQGSGGEVSGIELGTKVAFNDFLAVPLISNMGFDVNFTFSDSSQEVISERRTDGEGIVRNDEVLIEGKKKELPFIGNSENTYNLVLWYEDERFSVRMAYNYRSARLITEGSRTHGYQSLYQDDYGQLDLNFTFNVTDYLSIYFNGLNVTEEFQQAYLEYSEQKAYQNIYESRWSLGTRLTF